MCSALQPGSVEILPKCRQEGKKAMTVAYRPPCHPLEYAAQG